MTSPDIRKLQYLNDLITQTLDAITQRSFGLWGANPWSQPFTSHGYGYGAPMGLGVHPQLAFGAPPTFGPYAQIAGPWMNPYAVGYTPTLQQPWQQTVTGLGYGMNGIGAHGGVTHPFATTPFDRTGVNPIALS